jgi:hypothetical protein
MKRTALRLSAALLITVPLTSVQSPELHSLPRTDGEAVQTPIVTLQLAPPIVSRRPSQLIVTISTAAAIAPSQLTFRLPDGFRSIPPSPINLGQAGTIFKAFDIEATGSPVGGEKYVVAELSSDSAAVLTSQRFTFYYSPQITFDQYVVLSMIGAALGYLIRSLVEIRRGIQPPGMPAQFPARFTGTWSTFVGRHYRLVDGVVTLTLSLLAIVACGGFSAAPEFASSSAAALGFGIALGLLTNSGLITR